MLLAIKVIPQSRQNKIIGFYGALLKIQMQGVPEKGKVNESLIGFLAEEFQIPKGAFSIKQGLTSPVKKIQIDPQYSLKVDLFLMKFKSNTCEESID